MVLHMRIVTVGLLVVAAAFSTACSLESVGDEASASAGTPPSVEQKLADSPSLKDASERSPGEAVENALSRKSALSDTTFVAAAATSSADASSVSNWPQFRGPSGFGTSDATGLPVEWSQDANVVWKTPLPGAGASTPIVFGARVYLTAYTGYLVPGEPRGSLDDLQRHLLCIQRSDGKLLWKKSVRAALPEEKSIRDHGYAANSVAVDSDHVYAFFGKSGVFAFTHDGQQVWKANVGSGTHGWGTAASPVLYKNLVYINASVESQSLIALDRLTGKEEWRVDGIRESWNTPVIVKTDAGNDELVVAIFGKVLGLDPLTGDRLWNCDTDITWYMVPSAVAADGIVYVLGGRSGVAGLAVRAGGRGDVTQTHRLWTSNKGSNVTSPVYREDHLYWMHEKLGIAYCAKVGTGEVLYEKRLERAGQIYGSTVLADGRLYYLNRSGRTFVVAANPEFQLLATNDLRDGGQFNSSPAVSGNHLLIRSDKFLYCLGK